MVPDLLASSTLNKNPPSDGKEILLGSIPVVFNKTCFQSKVITP